MRDDDGSLSTLAVAHVDPSKMEIARELQERIPATRSVFGGVARVIRTGEAEIVPEITEELLRELDLDPAVLAMLRALGPRSSMMVPLKARGQVLGVISLVAAESGHHFDAEDLTLADDLASRAALTIDNARLYERMQRVAAEQAAVMERQAALLDLSHDAIFIRAFEADTIESWNRGAAELYGFPAADAIGRRSHELLQTIHPGPLPDARDTLMRTGRWEGELIHMTHAGTRVVVMSRWVLQWEDGRPTAILETNTDISERKRAEDALRDNEERLSRIVETNADAILIVDLHRRFIFANLAAERMTALPRARIIGRTSEELGWQLTTLDGTPLAEGHRPTGPGSHVVPAAPAHSMEFVLEHQDGRRLVLSARSATLWNAEGIAIGAVISVTDITDRKRAEDELRRLSTDLEARVVERTVQLEAANRELEAFAYSVSHDLRAPLRSMDGFSQVLVDRYRDSLDERGARYLAHIRDAAQEMGQLIDALLQLSRVTRTEMRREQVDLSELARSIVEHLRTTRPARDITVTIADGLTVDGDPRLLRVMLENLLGNAWKYTRKNPDAHIEFGVTREDDGLIYVVRDDGAGFDMTYASKLFAPFQRLHGAGEFEGTGIGLATVQRIVGRHGGSVWAESVVGQGATFYFTLQAGKKGSE